MCIRDRIVRELVRHQDVLLRTRLVPPHVISVSDIACRERQHRHEQASAMAWPDSGLYLRVIGVIHDGSRRFLPLVSCRRMQLQEGEGAQMKERGQRRRARQGRGDGEE
eukprot:2831380-Rhodomonas_salina.1